MCDIYTLLLIIVFLFIKQIKICFCYYFALIRLDAFFRASSITSLASLAAGC